MMGADYAGDLSRESEHKTFWEELRPVYQYFEENKNLPVVSIRTDGAYLVE